MRRLSFNLALMLLTAGACLGATPGNAADYRLDVGDQLRVKVFDWRPTIGDVHEWTALNADYRVGADGAVSLPLVGAIKAAGLTVEELADTISTRLQATVGTTIQPRATVEIMEYRPFFILGDVNKPGAYPYRPGLTVLEAISIAGGKYRVTDPALELTTTGELGVLHLQYTALLARRARLQAELDDAGSIVFPPALLQRQNDPDIAQLMAREQAMFKSQRDALNIELDSLSQLKSLLNGEVDSLQAKTRNVDQEVVLTKQELNNTTALVQRGLAIAPREYTQHQDELQTESRRLDLDTASLRAKEDIGKADQAIIELRNKARSNTETELTDADQKISEIAARIASGNMIVGGESSANGSPRPSPMRCLITRRSGGDTKPVEAEETAWVEPGDTIEVLRDAASVPQAAANTGAADDPTARRARASSVK